VSQVLPRPLDAQRRWRRTAVRPDFARPARKPPAASRLRDRMVAVLYRSRRPYQSTQPGPAHRHEAGHPTAQPAADRGERPDGVARARQPDPRQAARSAGGAGHRKDDEDETAVQHRAGPTTPGAIPAGRARHRCGSTSCARRRSAREVVGSARWAPSSSPKSSSAASAVTSPPTSTTRPRSSRHHQSPRAANSLWESSQPSPRASRPRCSRSRTEALAMPRPARPPSSAG
jgi:hypothetical protein